MYWMCTFMMWFTETSPLETFESIAMFCFCCCDVVMSYANEIFVSRSSPLEPAQRYGVPASKNIASVLPLLIMLARFLHWVSYFARSRSVSRLTVAAAPCLCVHCIDSTLLGVFLSFRPQAHLKLFEIGNTCDRNNTLKWQLESPIEKTNGFVIPTVVQGNF